jgi:hypothetical protein
LYADSPARAIVRDAKQFNGQFGCDWCEFEGVALVSNGGLPVRYYNHRTLVMRSSKKQESYALQVTSGNPVKGVNGMTVVDLGLASRFLNHYFLFVYGI